jgi:integration host factor subunit beta
METMVKKDIVQAVYDTTGLGKDKVEMIVDGDFKTLTEFLKDADPEVRIEIRGYGVLDIRKAKAKPKARNPRNNEMFFVHPHRKVFFKPGRLLKKSLHNPNQ